MSKKTTDNQPSSVLITEDMLPVYQAYVEAQAALKEAEAKRDAAKAKIIAFHKKNSAARIQDKGFSSTLALASRDTLLRDPIEKLLGKALPAECIKTTTYDQLKVSGQLING